MSLRVPGPKKKRPRIPQCRLKSSLRPRWKMAPPRVTRRCATSCVPSSERAAMAKKTSSTIMSTSGTRCHPNQSRNRLNYLMVLVQKRNLEKTDFRENQNPVAPFRPALPSTAHKSLKKLPKVITQKSTSSMKLARPRQRSP